MKTNDIESFLDFLREYAEELAVLFLSTLLIICGAIYETAKLFAQ